MKLKLGDIEFEAAHYIKYHEKCSNIHGHTYVISDLTLDVSDVKTDDKGITIDFGTVRQTLLEHFDHAFFIPKEDYAFWDNIRTSLYQRGIGLKLVCVEQTSVEALAKYIQRFIKTIFGVDCTFELYEGLENAVILEGYCSSTASPLGGEIE